MLAVRNDRMESVDVDGRSIAFRSAGTGPPVLLLHGAQADSRDWQYQFDVFAPHFTTIAWDAPGCGESEDLPSPDYDLDDLVHALVGFLHALQVSSAHIIGLSLGSILSLAFHERHPEAVRSLVLASAYAGWAGSLSPAEVQRRRRLVLQDLERPGVDAARDLVTTLLTPDAPRWMVEEQIAMISQSRPATSRAMVTNIATVDLRPLLSRIRAPTLLLYGQNDNRAPETVARTLHKGIPGSRLIFLPNAGHCAHIQAPDLWNRAVLNFLADIVD